MTMMRAVGAELRKLVHPLVLLVAILFLVFVAAEARTTYHFARLQTPVAARVSAQVEDDANAACAGVSPTSQQCQIAQLNSSLNSRFGDNGVQLGRVTNALSTWPGMLKFVSHHLVTGGGWILIGLLVCLQTAAEWRTRTATSTFNAVGSMRRFLFAKAASLWLFLIGLALVLSTVLYALQSLYLGTVGVPDPLRQPGGISTWHLAALAPASNWSSLPHGLAALGIAAGVWVVLVPAATALAAAIRKPLVVLVVWIACLSAAHAIGQQSNPFTRTFTRPVGDLLDLSATPYGIRDTEFWNVVNKPSNLNALAGSTHLDLAGVLLWGGIAVLVAAVAGIAASRRRVLG